MRQISAACQPSVEKDVRRSRPAEFLNRWIAVTASKPRTTVGTAENRQLDLCEDLGKIATMIRVLRRGDAAITLMEPRVPGIDDRVCRRCRYGTILCDLERGGGLGGYFAFPQ